MSTLRLDFDAIGHTQRPRLPLRGVLKRCRAGLPGEMGHGRSHKSADVLGLLCVAGKRGQGSDLPGVLCSGIGSDGALGHEGLMGGPIGELGGRWCGDDDVHGDLLVDEAVDTEVRIGVSY